MIVWPRVTKLTHLRTQKEIHKSSPPATSLMGLLLLRLLMLARFDVCQDSVPSSSAVIPMQYGKCIHILFYSTHYCGCCHAKVVCLGT